MLQEKIDYTKIYVSAVQGRYVTCDHLKEFISGLSESFIVALIGKSVRGEGVKSITYGYGPKRILLWSQMHGNESTTTKAVLDILNFLNANTSKTEEIARSCTLKIIPILNPDGAMDYTRANANGIDLNRDAINQSQPESRILKKEYDAFNPDFCFNLHDQRTIFNVGTSNSPATVSFLAPAFDMERNNSPSRKLSMQLIAAMNSTLQKMIPNQVGRYDDGFNANCVGDAFQMKNTPTVLVEAGHYKEDYQREKTREFIFHALLKSIETIVSDTVNDYRVSEYLAIPANGKQYVDILVEHVPVLKQDGDLTTTSVAIQYKEILKDGKVSFRAEIMKIYDSSFKIFGHKTLDYGNTEDLDWLRENKLTKLLH